MENPASRAGTGLMRPLGSLKQPGGKPTETLDVPVSEPVRRASLSPLPPLNPSSQAAGFSPARISEEEWRLEEEGPSRLIRREKEPLRREISAVQDAPVWESELFPEEGSEPEASPLWQEDGEDWPEEDAVPTSEMREPVTVPVGSFSVPERRPSRPYLLVLAALAVAAAAWLAWRAGLKDVVLPLFRRLR